MAYSKLFSSIVHSSLWTEEDHVRLLFVTLLAIADREGYVYGSRMGLERLANIDYDEDARNPWQVLMDPDSDSSDLMRNPDNQGRRIEQVPGGFRILNYSYYRSLRNEDDRREQNREAQQRYREKISTSKQKSSLDKPPSANVSHGKQSPSASASASASEKKEEKKVRVRTSVNGLIDSEWIASLKEDQTYQGIDVDRELGKMQNWCKVRGLTPSRRRFVSWLNRDRPISDKPILSPQHRENRINFFNTEKQKIHRAITDPNNPPSWAVKELARIDQQLKDL